MNMKWFISILLILAIFSCREKSKYTQFNFNPEAFNKFLQGMEINFNQEKNIIIVTNETVCQSCQNTVFDFIQSHNFINLIIINSRFLKASPYLLNIEKIADQEGILFVEDRDNLFESLVYPVMPYPLIITFRYNNLINAYELTNANLEFVSDNVLNDLK